jgi:hypothetical protein
LSKKKKIKSIRKVRTGSREWSNDVAHYMSDCSCESVGAVVPSTALRYIDSRHHHTLCDGNFYGFSSLLYDYSWTSIILFKNRFSFFSLQIIVFGLEEKTTKVIEVIFPIKTDPRVTNGWIRTTSYGDNGYI